jgi:hypothetical protein
MNSTLPKTTSPTPAGPAHRRTPAGAAPNFGPGSYMAAVDATLQARRDHLAPLWAMKPEQRVAAMHRGELTMPQLLAWAARYPHQVPTINGEFAFIAAFTDGVAEADR